MANTHGYARYASGCRCDTCRDGWRVYQAEYRRRRRDGEDTRQRPSEHGSHSRYRRGCRCETCRAAQAAYAKQRREQNRERLRQGLVDPPHGTPSTYGNYGCRCDACVAAMRMEGRRRRPNAAYRAPDGASIAERILPRIQRESGGWGCWLWTGFASKLGYGQVSLPGRKKDSAHRVVYEHFVGLIPDGLELDHLCRNPRCVNPDHLEPVTRSENQRRRRGAARMGDEAFVAMMLGRCNPAGDNREGGVADAA